MRSTDVHTTRLAVLNLMEGVEFTIEVEITHTTIAKPSVRILLYHQYERK